MPRTAAEVEAAPPADPKRANRAIWWLLGVAVLASPIVFYFVWTASHWQPVAAELEAIRAAGHPAAEVEAWHAYPEGPNPAEALLAVFPRMRLADDYRAGEDDPMLGRLPLVYSEPELPAPGEPLPEQMAEIIERVLAANAEALERLHAAAALPVRDARYPVDLSDGILTLLPHLQRVRHGSGLLAVEAVAHAEADRPEAAARSIRSALRIAASLEREPVVISQLVRVRAQSGAVDALERAAQRQMPDDALAELIDALADAEQGDALAPGLIAERATVSDLFLHGWRGADLALVSPTLFENQWDGFLHYIRGDWHEDHLIYLELADEQIAAGQLPLHERIEAFERLNDKLLAYGTATPLARARITEELLPSWVRGARNDLRAIARVRTARTALAAERYRLAHGRPPERLDDLVGTFLDTIPADPFTGQPLRYAREPGRFTVYSVGEDRTDHGGARTNPTGERYEAGADVPFTVYRD